MKALFTLKSAKEISLVIATLILSTPWIYPEVVLASSLQTNGQNTALVFSIQNSSITGETVSKDENQTLLTYDQIIESDPLVSRLKQYLEDHNSPLAPYADEMVKQPQWQRALAISWVESNFCIHNLDNNCSGIGVAPGNPAWRKYTTNLDWFKDMTKLLEQPRYKEKYTTFKQMKGIYVYPGSPSWVNGATQKYAELMALTTEAETESLQQNVAATQPAPLATFPELALAN